MNLEGTLTYMYIQRNSFEPEVEQHSSGLIELFDRLTDMRKECGHWIHYLVYTVLAC